MNEILIWLSQYPLALNIAGFLIAFGISAVFVIYIFAFIQGREISLWPPKIGENPNIKKIPKKVDNISAIPAKKINIAVDDIQILPKAINDCKRLNISQNEVKKYVLEEIQSHPLMFLERFSSTPHAFLHYVLFMSWDKKQVCIEGILSREKAYPVNDTWFSCAALYRQATSLSYRTTQQVELMSIDDAKRAIALYQKLIDRMKILTDLLKKHGLPIQQDVSDYESLLDEAEIAFYRNDNNIGVMRLEIILSNIHKFLLNHTPPTSQITSPESQNIEGTSGKKILDQNTISILLAEDSHFDMASLLGLLGSLGYNNCVTATNSTDALKAMIENDFDLVITDGKFGADKREGREIAIAAKQINPKSKIIFLSYHSDLVINAKNDLPFAHTVNKSLIGSPESFYSLLKDVIDTDITALKK